MVKDIYTITDDYRLANNIHERTIKTKFRNEHPELVYDRNNDVTLTSLYIGTDIEKTIPSEDVRRYLTAEMNEKLTGLEPMAKMNYIEKWNKFNANKSFYATMDSNGNIEVLSISDDVARKEANDKSYGQLNSQLRDILETFGIKVGCLDELEERMGIKGVTDFEKLKTASNGIVELIRIAKGQKGEEVLPEEFAHFAIDALGEHPLVTRLLTSLDNDDAIKEVLGDEYEEYSEKYAGDRLKLIKEAAGKMVAKKLIMNQDTPKFKSIIQRIVDAIRQFFSGMNENMISKAIIDADYYANEISKGVLDKTLVRSMSLDNITTEGEMYGIVKAKGILSNPNVEVQTEAVNKTLDMEMKKALIASRVLGWSPNRSLGAKKRFKALRERAEMAKALKGFVSYISEYTTMLKSSKEELNKKTNMSDLSILAAKTRAAILNAQSANIAYTTISDMLKNQDESTMSDEDRQLLLDIKAQLANLSAVMNELIIDINYSSKRIHEALLKPYLGEEYKIDTSLGESAGKFIDSIDIHNMNDISKRDRWLRAAADSKSDLIRIYDTIIKTQKEKARLKTIELQKEIAMIAKMAEREGVTNFDFASQLDENGNQTGYYMSVIDMRKYDEDLEKYKEEMRKKFPDKDEDVTEREAYERKIHEWEMSKKSFNKAKGVYEIDLKKAPEYRNDKYYTLSPVQRKYLEMLLDVKERIEKLIPPEHRHRLKTIKIHKDNLERIRKAGSIADVGNVVKNAFLDRLVVRSDDTMFGSSMDVTDFTGELAQGLPLFYLHTNKDEDENDMSTDLVSNLIAYGAMANNFSALSDYVDMLEVSKGYVEKNATINSPDTTERKIEIWGENMLVRSQKSKSDSNLTARINDLFAMTMYGKLVKDEGTFQLGSYKISKAKVWDTVNELTALSTYALNFLGGVSNVLTGIGMMNIETFGNQFFSAADNAKADASYGHLLKDFIADFGNNVKTNKLYLIDELFNVLQDYEKSTKDIKWNQKGFLLKLFNASPLFLFNNCGEHWLQNRTALAVLHSTKVINKRTGHKMSLYDALTVKPIDPANPKSGARLTYDDLVLVSNGKPVTEKTIIALTQKIKHINQRLHGIYNRDDMNAFQRRGIGRFVIMFRKWMWPSWDRRFRSAIHNYDLGETEEGYYVTTYNFMKRLFKELKTTRDFTFMDKLTVTEKANLRKALTEIIQFAVVSLGVLILDAGDDDDDDDDDYMSKFTEFQVRRLRSELAAQVPFMAPGEVLKIMRSPAAGTTTLEDLWKSVTLIFPWNWSKFVTEVESGRFKGWTQGERDLYNAPIPLVHTIERSLDPSIGIPFLKSTW